MIQISYDLETGSAKLARPAVLKLGADVPVRLTFSAAPGAVSGIALALGTDAAEPAVLAFTEDFSAESATVWTALLDASDTRLAAFMEGKASAVVKCELATILDGVHEVAPNLDVTVQQALVSGAETSYANGGAFKFLTTLTGYTGGGATNLDGVPTANKTFAILGFDHPTDGLRFFRLTAGTDAEASPGIIRPDDYHAATNARVWKLRA